jgi:hypothetical protein
MAKLSLVKGTTSYLSRIFIQDSSSTTGAGLTGLTSGSSGLVCYRARDDDGNAAGTAISLSAGTRGTWSSGGFVEKDSANLPGVYEFGIPNAALATGSNSVLIMFKGATNQAALPLEIELTATNNQDAVRGGLTALPNANAEAAGGLYTRGSGAGQLNQAANGQVDTNVARWLNTAVSTPTVAGVPNVNAKTWNDLATVALPLIPTTAGRTLDVSATGEAGVDWANVGSPTTTNGLTGTTIATSQVVASVTGAVGSVTGAVGSVTGAVGSVTGAVGSVTARVTANTDQLAGQTVTAGAGVTFPSSVASPTNLTAGTITTATNLTNAPTAGDFTATMKTSIGTAVAASAVASVTGNVGGNVAGSVATVTDITTTGQAELAAVPAANASPLAKLNWLFLLARNKLTQTATTQIVKADDGSTTVGTSVVSDDGTVATRGEFS